MDGRRRRQSRPASPPRERSVRLKDGTSAVLRGLDVYSDLRLALDQAILGTVAQVTTLDSTAKVKVPPGTSSGVKLRLKGKGARSKEGRTGNHYVTVHIDVPKNLDENQKKLLIQLMQRIKKT